ncbi:hypothetical protein [Mucilaginibacter sp.]
MKKLLLAIVATFSITCAVAQKNTLKLSIGPDAGIPIGEGHDYFDFAIGGTLKLEVPVNASPFHITITSGYNRFIGKKYTTYYSSYYVPNEYANKRIPGAGFIPVKLGTKYYFSNGLYFEGEYGTSIHTGDGEDHPFAFVYAPGVGLSSPAGGGNAIDIGVRYEGRVNGNGSLNQLALRLAYKFGL